MNNQPTKKPARQTLSETERAERLNAALEDMRQGKAPQYFSADDEFRQALYWHTQTFANAEIDEDFKEDVEQILLQRFGKQQALEQAPLTQAEGLGGWGWRWLLAPVSALAVMALVFFTTRYWPALEKGTTPLLNSGKQLAKVINNSVNKTKDDAESMQTSKEQTHSNQSMPTKDKSNGGEKDNNNSGDTTAGLTEQIAQTEPELAENNQPSTTPSTVPPLAQTPGVELAGVQTEMVEIDALQADIESTISDLEAILQELEEVEAANNFDTILTDLEAI